MKKKKGIIGEFKEFALKGNVVDLAIGVIIGGAFQGIVKSLVDDIIMPLVSGIFGNVDFTNRYLVLRGDVPAGTSLAAAKEMGAITFNYGSFITVLINFLILAVIIFLMVKAINKLRDIPLKKKVEIIEEAPTTKMCPYCKTEISIEAVRCPHCTSDLKEE